MNEKRFLRRVSGACVCLILLSVVYVVCDNIRNEARQGTEDASRQKACVVTGPILAFAEDSERLSDVNAAAVTSSASETVYLIDCLLYTSDAADE